MRTGFYVVGKMLGYKQTSFSNRETGEIKERHTVGLQMQEPDGYGGYNTLTQDLKVDDRAVNEGLKRNIEQAKGKLVMILVFPREWVMDGGRKGITYNFDENSTIEIIEGK